MADNRYFAKMDVGYYSNPKWFKVERFLRKAMLAAMPTAEPQAMPQAMQGRVRCALRAAQVAHSESVYYCREHSTDGVFPVEAIKRIVGIISEDEEAAITALFEVGMWVNKPLGEAEVRDFLEHQDSAAKVRARSEAAKKRAAARWSKDAPSNARSNAPSNARGNAASNAHSNAEERRGEERILSSGDASAEAPKAPPRKRGTRIPNDFMITDQMRIWAAEKAPLVNTERATEKFINHWQAKTGQAATKLDWNRTWQNWMLNDQERAESRPGGYRNQDQIMAANAQAARARDAARAQTSPLRDLMALEGGAS